MPIVAVFQSPSVTRDTYEEIVRRLAGGKRLESPDDWPVKGLLVHAAGEGPTGFRVVDVWETEDAFRQFGDKLKPIMEALGVEAQPEVYKAHAFVCAR
jgi:hypothetical protein